MAIQGAHPIDDPRRAARAPRDRLTPQQIARRWQMYEAASPLFRQLGYSGVTVEALAHACSMSPSSLYHYFDSKLSFALFPLTHDSGWCKAIEAYRRQFPGDSRAQLRAFIDALADRSDELRLALRVASQVGSEADARASAAIVQLLSRARDELARLLRDAAPELGGASAELAEALLMILVGDLPGVERRPARVRRQMWHAATALLDSPAAPAS